MSSLLPTRVTITDDTMREGLQIESPDIAVSEKLRLLDALGETGAKVISIGSFAHPKWTPSMACIDEVAQQFVPKPGIKYTAAVFNKKGFDRADAYYPKIDVRGRRFGTHVELCDSFARRNYNRTQAQQIAGMDGSIAGAKAAGAEAASVALGNPFGSNFEGPFSLDQRMDLLAMMIGKWHEAGIPVTKVSFLDAMGWNMPHEVRETLTAIRDRYPEVETFHMHLHNTRGATMASFYEALMLGATEFDTSIGGMGGCPYCGNGRAAGHVPTEDFVHLCHEMGIETGYDRGGGRRPPALGPCVEGGGATAPRCRTLPAGYAVRGDLGGGGPFPQRPGGVRRADIAVAAGQRLDRGSAGVGFGWRTEATIKNPDRRHRAFVRRVLVSAPSRALQEQPGGRENARCGKEC